MRYYIKYTDNGYVQMIGIGPGGTEITQAEYEEQLAIIGQKIELSEKLYRGEIGEADIPTDWLEEIKADVKAMIENDGEYQGDDIDEALAILTGEVSK